LANREYEFPSQRGIGFLTINETEFIDVIKDSDDEIVRILARKIGISGLISEELCYRAKIEKTKNAQSLSDNQLKEFFNVFKNLRNQLLFGEINAHIIYDEKENQVAVLPFELEIFLDYKKIFYNSFNQAVDTYYSKLDLSAIKPHQNKKINDKIDAYNRILQNQEEYLQELYKKKDRCYEYGDFIYAHFSELEKLFHVISEAKDKGYNWYEINKKLLNAKKAGVEGVELFVKIIPESRKLLVNILNQEVNLDLRKTIGENANLIYSKGKKAEQKIKGTIEAINKSKEKMTKFVKEKESLDDEVVGLVKKRKQAWYEKFRWFHSSNGFLIIGGRDATSNEVIFKTHMQSEDLVFHTNIPGSPLVIVKNPDNKEIPELTINEAAIFVGSYSNAWKEDWGYIDVWYVNPNQVSKTPPTGEFLPKGSFMISGKKNVIKNAKTELAIGLELEESKTDTVGDERVIFLKILCGPLSAIKTQVSQIIKIKPSKDGLSKGKLAKEIKSRLINQSDDLFKKWIKLLKVDEIILSLPSGTSIVIP
ncbi:MAG: ribosome rescue protein RqcH, partial [Promethearchaeota archaeon]